MRNKHRENWRSTFNTPSNSHVICETFNLCNVLQITIGVVICVENDKDTYDKNLK